MTRNESDTAWKEILDAYFKEFMDYCLPELSELIDWGKPFVSLDKELQAISKDIENGKRLLDKLFKVYLKDGCEQWILIHIEIQGTLDSEFEKRMFIYGYRIFDRYKQPVVSCAILTDDNKKWRPRGYKIGLAGSHLSSEFLVIKLIDYRDRRNELEISMNPFASVILVQLAALNAKSKPDVQRKQVKFALTRRLYEKGFNKKQVNNLYKFIDWLIGLPPMLEIEYLDEVYDLEESTKMAYVTNAEKFGIEKGITIGKKQGIEMKALEIAKCRLEEGCELAFVERVTKMSLAQLESLQEELEQSTH